MRPSESTRAIEPPPAPISTISITGMRSGRPLPFEKAVDARHFERARGLRPRLVDQADLCGRAAHVERQHLVEPMLARDAAREDRAARRARLDKAHREADRSLDRRDAAARAHQQHGAFEPVARELALEVGQIAPHQRLDVGIGAGGGEALVFTHLRRHVGRERHRDLGQALPYRVADAALVLRIGEAVQEADRDRLHLLRRERVDRGREARLVERHQHVALRVDRARAPGSAAGAAPAAAAGRY